MMRLEHDALDGFAVSTRALEPGQRVDWHDHGRPTLCVVGSGRVLEEDARRVRERADGDLVFRSEPDPHRNQALSRSLVLVVELSESALQRLRALGLPGSGAHFARTERTRLLARQLGSLRGGTTSGDRLALVGCLHELMAELVRHEARRERLSPPWLLRVRDRLHDELAESPDLEELARDTPVSGLALRRAFRRHFGLTVTDYLLQRRLEEACRLLAKSALPLADVAAETGFCDQSHLTRVMRRRIGTTPGEYRRRHRDA